jgi:very-short-patch-repair endonuclease
MELLNTKTAIKKSKDIWGDYYNYSLFEYFDSKTYLREYKFKDCFYKKELPFDFYLPKHNICIEFNGKQHYESIEHFGGDIRLKEQIEKDNIRRSYCIINNIKLVEIKYDESIEEKINFIYEKEKV